MKVYKEVKDEITELVILIGIAKKYEAVVAHGFLPIETLSTKHHQHRLFRIAELAQKYRI